MIEQNVKMSRGREHKGGINENSIHRRMRHAPVEELLDDYDLVFNDLASFTIFVYLAGSLAKSFLQLLQQR